MTKLRAVTPTERAPQRKRRLTVTQAAKAESHRDLLAALRDRLAQTVENPNCNPVALAALARQISLISAELERLDTVRSEDPVTVAAATPDEDFDASAL